MVLKISLRASIGFGVVLALSSCGPRLATTSADVGAGEGEVLALADRADDTAPTYHADVAPILQKNCVTCHREAQATDFDDGNGFYSADLVAPMGLRTYEDARAWARRIAYAVEERRMPPWGASVEFRGKFSNERYLEDEEIATLVAWAEAGAPAGDPSEASLVDYVETDPNTWALENPDLEFRFAEPFLVDGDAVDLYVNVHLKLSEEQHPEDRWIKASELRAGSNAVHHINTQYLVTIAPGRETVYRWPKGFGMFLPAEATLLFDMHFHKEPGEVVPDRSGGALVFYEDGEVIDYLVETFSALNGTGAPGRTGSLDLRVPAGAEDYTFTATQLFEEDTYLLSTGPHMHFRGKSIKLELEYPDGRKELLVDVPRYDFMWQHTYDFKEPVLMPGGSVLHLTGTWDNSAGNPHNPDPTTEVRWGRATTDEMLTGRFTVANAKPMGYVVGRDPIPEIALEDAARYQRTVDRSTSGRPTAKRTVDGPVDLRSNRD